jgi:hypothetical protein
MSMSTCLLRPLLVLTFVVAVAGCASTPKSTAPVHVRVTAAGVVCFNGQEFGPDQLVRRLDKAGVQETQEVRVHLEDPRNTRLQRQLSTSLVSNGYTRVLFLAAARASSEVVGEPTSRTEAQVQHGEPPTLPPQAK